MEDNKYYTPDITDLCIGYECEVMDSSTKWSPNTITRKTNGEGFDMSIMGRIKPECIRTKYLDKGDIESLKWKEIEELQERDYIGYKAMKKRGLYPEILRLLWWSNNKLKISSHLLGVLYWGECKSINELRVIMKWLEIR